ncbi:hypothetical protein [Blastomonas sp. SL216]|uniref:hypothetical protein n=1 Tax=Blastomonas sp. SL216 TaxID=2995169 RepID=UPI002377208B|nr:hypothetical protein OU999_12820 [Blastomonas sp. SL216]
MTENDNAQPSEPVDCTEETAQRAGAKKTSLNDAAETEKPTEPEIDKDDISEADLDEAIEESMDASDPPSFTQP